MKCPSRPLALTTTAALVSLAATAMWGTGAAASPASATHHSTTTTTSATSGHAYGSLVQASNLAGSGKTAETRVGCGATHATRRNSTAHADLAPLGTARAVRTHSHTSTNKSGALKTVTEARTAHVSLLGGQIALDALTATAVAHTATGTTSGHSELLGLKIGGKPMVVHPAPNTAITIPGLAKVVLNYQHRVTGSGVNRIVVDALKVTLLGGSGYGPLGTTVVVGHATAALHALTGPLLRGSAWGSEVTVGSLVTSNPTFRAWLPCSGASNTVRHRGAGINLPKALTTRAVATRAHAKPGTTPTSTDWAKVDGLNLLNGLVKASVIKAQANASKVNGKVVRTNDGSHFVGLSINGTPMNDDISPNTKFSLLGIGTLWIDRVVKTAHGVTVHMVELVLGHATDGMKKGTVIDVANAKAAVKH